jgi:NTP pyrophosphatase (non-canonical NTP hydrolase)
MTDIMTAHRHFVNQADFTEDYRERQLLGALGLAGESGEVVDYLKKVLIHGEELDRSKLVDELGDVMWYIHLIYNTYNISMTEVLEGNIKKLCERYPEQNGSPGKWIAGTE